MHMIFLRTVSIALLLVLGTRPVEAQGRSHDRGRAREGGNAEQQHIRSAEGEHPIVVPEDEQRRRSKVQQQRSAEYRRQLGQQVQAMQQQTLQLQQQRRLAQFRAQEQYVADIRRQQQGLQVQRDFAKDPWVGAPYMFRYVANGANRQTNAVGAEVLRQSVRTGYAQGYRAGQADQQDHSPSSYQSTFAYRDANYGYAGRDVDQSDYNFYFRQGLQRGYDDGFTHRSQYGTASNGSATILTSLLNSILGFQPIR